MNTTTFKVQGDPGSHPYLYRRGWLLHEGPAPAGTESWVSFKVGQNHFISAHPATQVTSASSQSHQIVLVGYPLDIENHISESTRIATLINSKLDPHGQLTDEAIRYISYLGGRFICIVANQTTSELSILTDCVASYPVYWTSAPTGNLIASTHASLCAAAARKDVDRKARELIKLAANMATPGTLFPPGTLTGYSDVWQILPNHVLELRDGHIGHTRYYPFQHQPGYRRTTETAYNSFSDQFRKHVELIAQFGALGISLTGGRDSQATLAAAAPHLNQNSITWTYVNSQNPHPEHRADYESAQALATAYGIEHSKVDLAASTDAEFEKAYRTTMGAAAQMPRIPLAYHAQLPADLVELQSMGAEVGTGFYKNRDSAFSVDRLCKLYVRTKFGELPQVRQEIQRYIEYADFRSEQFGNVDYHDLFYWEHRLGRWGSRRIQEVDLAHRVFLPFNSRGIVESLMAPPLEERKEKQALVRFAKSTQRPYER